MKAAPCAFIYCISLVTMGAEAPGISFTDQVAPVLVSKCLSCHSAEKAKGEYRLHSFEALLLPGKSKAPAVVPGKPEESELYRRLITRDEDDRMPQKEEPLPAKQIEMIKQWILEGPKLDRGEPHSFLSSLLPRAPHPVPPERYPRAVPILALAFTPSGEIAASGYHEVTVWNLEGQLTRRITNIPQRVHALAFSPTRPILAVAGGKPGRAGELSIYDIESGLFETNFLQTADELLAVTFSRNGKLLATGGADNTIHIFDCENGRKITTIQQHADWVTSLYFNAEGNKIASASRDRTARIYDPYSGELHIAYTGHSAPLFAVAFLSSDSVVSGGRDRAIHIWNTEDGKKKNELGGFTPDIHELIISEESLFAAAADKEVREYSISARKLLRTYSAHKDAVYSLALHPPSGKLGSGSYDGVVNIWNIKNGQLEHSFIAAPGLQNAR
jgi:hypothetical protein